MEKRMSKNLAQIQKQIAQLQKQAEVLKAKEIGGVVARIKDAIEHYGLTPKDLFGSGTGAAKGNGAKAVANGKATKKAASPAKFRDDAGHSWTGRGKRPNWFKTALAAGKTPEDLLVK
jgi:DNA-binding protein H-NS